MNRTIKSYLILSILIFTAVALPAQQITDILTGKASVSKDQYLEGEEFTITLSLKIKDGWYLYDTVDRINDEGIGPAKTEVYSADESLYVIKPNFKTSKVYMEYDTNMHMEVGKFKKMATFTIQAKANRNIDFNKGHKIATYVQVCNTESGKCLIPDEVKFTILPIEKRDPEELINKSAPSKGDSGEDGDSSSSEGTQTSDTIVDSEGEVDTAGANLSNDKENSEKTIVQSNAESEIEQAKKEGAWTYFLLAMSFGGLALLTPCVFPMIPITVSFFTKRAEAEHSSPIVDAVLFALGIIGTFVGIGLVVAAIFEAGAVGDIATNPWVNIFIGAIFLIFAFNLFGAFEIQIPTSVLNKLNAKANSGGKGGIMLMGLVFSLTSFTCTVPFVGSSLVSTADGEWLMPVVGMLGFSLIFALPFFLLAIFPTFLKKLPKSGGWMNNLKVVMGFVEIAAALKFLSNVDLVLGWELLSRQTFVAIWIAIAVLITLYILGVFLSKLDSPIERVGALRAVFAIFFLSIAIALVPGLWNEPLGEIDAFLPPKDYANAGGQVGFYNTGTSGQESKVEWHKTLDKALAEAKKTNKNVFVDFTGWTCTNCRLMESNMFPRPEVKSRMDKMVKAKLYTDRRKEPELSNKAIMQERFNSIALPLYVLMTPEGEVISKIEFTRDEEEFVDFLDLGL